MKRARNWVSPSGTRRDRGQQDRGNPVRRQPRAGSARPPEPVRKIIELIRSRALEQGFEIGVYNRRGVTVRMPQDGGSQERALAERYRRDAEALRFDWLHTAAVGTAPQLAAMPLKREDLLMKLGPHEPSRRRLGVSSTSPSIPRRRRSAISSTAGSCGRCAGAKAVIFCAPICPGKTPPSCGSSRFGWSRSRPRSKPSRTISDCDRSTTRWSSGSKRVSSSPSSPIVCTSRCAPNSARSPQGSPRGPCSTSLPPSRCSTSLPDHRPAHADPQPLHRAQRRPTNSPRSAQPDVAAPASTAHHCSRPNRRAQHPDVVETFRHDPPVLPGLTHLNGPS